MTNTYLFTDQQVARIGPHVSRSDGKPRVDARRVLSGIIYVTRNGLQWNDAP
jgi:transposase